jgi:hypothetical protein
MRPACRRLSSDGPPVVAVSCPWAVSPGGSPGGAVAPLSRLPSPPRVPELLGDASDATIVVLVRRSICHHMSTEHLRHVVHQSQSGLDRTGCEQYDELVMAIRCSRVFTGEQFSEGPATVLLDRGKIVGVETGHTQLNESWQVAEYPNATVLPGLVDTHVHLVADSEVGALDRVSGLGDEEPDAVITDGLRRQLAAGVTTVRDLGDLRYAVVNRRDVQRAGRTRKPEPTIVASGPPLTRVGGHCHVSGRRDRRTGIRSQQPCGSASSAGLTSSR